MKDREFTKKGIELKRTTDAQFSDLVRFYFSDIPTFEMNHSIRGIEKTGDQVEYGALSGTIRTDQPNDFSLINKKIQIIDSD